ncbi:hypothetical protein BH10PSE19_BH10PSE19_16660 [soil metagenome]
MRSFKQTPYLLLLFIAVLFSSWLLVTKHKNSRPIAQDSRYPDLIMEDVIATRMDASGFPKSRLFTPK